MIRLVQNALLLVVSVAAVLLVLEFGSRLFLQHSTTHVVDAQGAITSMQRDPGDAGKGLRPGFVGRLRSGEFDVAVRLDALGFRPPVRAGEVQARPSVHVTLLGDSFMFGWGVEQEEAYASRLAEELHRLSGRPVVVTNLGVPGTGQAAQLQFLRETPQPAPDFIVAGFYVADRAASGNDVMENLSEVYRQEGTSDTEARAEERVGFLRRSRRWLKNRSNLYRLVEARLTALLLARMSGAMALPSDDETLRRAWAVTDSLVAEMAHAADARGAVLVGQYAPNMLDAARADSSVYARLKHLAAETGMRLGPNPIALFQRGQDEVSDYYYPVDGHWTVRAHQRTAEAMAAYLADKVGLPGTDVSLGGR